MKKFNLKEFHGNRIERTVYKYQNIVKIWVWDTVKKVYTVANGNPYLARRNRTLNGITLKERQAFYDLESAKAWQNQPVAVQTFNEIVEQNKSPTFYQIIKQFKIDKFNSLSKSTQEIYARNFNSQYFQPLEKLKMCDITPFTIDEWIRHLKTVSRHKTRTNFKSQLNILKSVISYYSNINDSFISPVKKRHSSSVFLELKNFKRKDLSESDFLLFRDELSKLKNGLTLSALATVQYYQALRVSETSAISFESVKLDLTNPINSRLVIDKSVRFNSNKKAVEIQLSFKNAKSNSGAKESPLFEESHNKIVELLMFKKAGDYLFTNDEGKLFNYRQIEGAYNRAFKKAGLNYTGTHVMRHGGARNVFDKSGGDWGITKQLLGNSDMRTVQTYAVRSTTALNEFAKTTWSDQKNKIISES